MNEEDNTGNARQFCIAKIENIADGLLIGWMISIN